MTNFAQILPLKKNKKKHHFVYVYVITNIISAMFCVQSQLLFCCVVYSLWKHLLATNIAPNIGWLHTFFKISFSVLHRRINCMRVWKDMTVSEWFWTLDEHWPVRRGPWCAAPAEPLAPGPSLLAWPSAALGSHWTRKSGSPSPPRLRMQPCTAGRGARGLPASGPPLSQRCLQEPAFKAWRNTPDFTRKKAVTTSCMCS